MPAIRTARARAREELTREIKQEARRQLASVGAQQLSLRAVARELGMASSALYRYFPSRDELLTALIIDAYNELGDAADHALAGTEQAAPRDRWCALWTATRDWARANPHEFALVFGTPVPGYAAPRTTVEPAARLPLALIGVVRDAPLRPTPPGPPPQGALPGQLTALAAAFAPGLPPHVVARGVSAWVQLIGLIGFELHGHLVGSIDPADDFFTWTAAQTADTLGL
ncbi:TetR family transcriptional regulator [Kitasatospora xanthocidica]|uniref:TetR/AcrR family transcriptional regulator n=1 Tax=Kitasatospora xanthocidica TaxID=83382 RepID=UPI0016723AF9|nr:TetR/AcrR family transcriptional regulator [Kitasatospora xanthocidica]GHF69820.1 TetR family transcriptional regulator [Kitasatospora xanthocidica]